LHDLCYSSAESKLEGRRDKLHGVQDVPLPQYGPNLEKLVSRLEQTGARLVWASTTVVPEGEAGRFAGTEIPYNLVARDVMARHSIPTDDLYSLTESFPAAFFQAPGNVHYTDEGYVRIARQVADSIESALNRQP
jgi:lysophospholipase L1-like esterase